MGGEIVSWPLPRSGTLEVGFAERLEGLVAVFRAIEAGELLAGLPPCELAEENHRSATKLLAIVERELVALARELRNRN